MTGSATDEKDGAANGPEALKGLAPGARIGLIGIGIMGHHFGRRLRAAGYEVAAWNRTRAKAEALLDVGVVVADTPAMAAQGADAVIVMVADGPTSDAVIGGAGAADPATDGDLPAVLDTLSAGATLIVMSSIPQATAAAQARRAAACGVAYLDAPVSGGEPGARDGTLAIMAGGDEATFHNAAALFSVFGRPTFMGPAGTGSLAKLANQTIVGGTILTVAEAMLLVERGGGRPEALADALAGGFADGAVLQNHGRRMAAGEFVPGAKVTVQLKDLNMILALADQLGLVLPGAEVAREVYAGLAAAGDGDLDHNAALIELRRRNGLS